MKSLTPLALILFAIGATAGSALDAIHTHSGTTVYTSPIRWAFDMAWWTPPLFGLAGLSIGISYPLMKRLRGVECAPVHPVSRVAMAFVGFVALYFVSGFLPASNPVKLAVLAAGTLALGATMARTRMAFALAALAALAGPLTEIILVSQNTFRHLQPDFAGIPMWLPALYASGAFAFAAVGNLLATRLSAETPSTSTYTRHVGA
jgi:hypothetical protein